MQIEKKLDIKYNIPSIKIFLDIFNLTLEEKENYDINSSLGIYMNDIEVGKVDFDEEKINIYAASIYGDLQCKVSYSRVFGFTDVESLETIGEIGMHADYHNDFKFNLTYLNGGLFFGDFVFQAIIDNEFGTRVNPHFALNYQEGRKKYVIKCQEDGCPFQFSEERASFKEKIKYILFDTHMGGLYISHSKFDKFCDGANTYDYQEYSFISKTSNHENMNKAVVHKSFDKMVIVHKCGEFRRISQDDCSSEAIKNKANMMNLIDPSLKEKINRLLAEFSVDGISFLERMLLYGFANYSNEEIYSLFSLDKGNINLREIYYGKEDMKLLEYKIFGLPRNG